jgi:FkbM family methyltransferase
MGSNTRSPLPHSLVRWSRRLRDLPGRFREWPGQRKALGSRAALQLAWSAFRYPIGDPADPPGPLSQILIPGLPYPFHFRHGTSDIPVIRQIFVRREYLMLEELKDVKTILDVGANIGAAAVYLLHLFPDAKLIAIEPAPGNFAVLQKNLASYQGRATAVPAALWSSETNLQIQRGAFRDGLDWSIQVKPADPATSATVPGITMPQLLASQNLDQIDLLKIDIEGAERELFAARTTWLSQVRTICIELHDDPCRATFQNALAPFPHHLQTRGETTLCHLR